MALKPADIDAYIAAYPEERQVFLKQIRATIKEAVPEAEEAISYGMPAFKLNGQSVWFAAYKSHIGLYAMYGMAIFEEEMTPFKGIGTKDALHFPYNQPLPLALIAKIVAYKLKDNQIVEVPSTTPLAQTEVLDKGPFYHGTKADLQIGDLLTAGFNSNYKSDIVMNHIYFTALPDGAGGLAAALAKGEGRERVYIVEPTGSFENDPNVTDKKFPGNPTRSYRSRAPLKIVGELTDWVRLTPQELQMWRENIAKIEADENAKIIN